MYLVEKNFRTQIHFSHVALTFLYENIKYWIWSLGRMIPYILTDTVTLAMLHTCVWCYNCELRSKRISKCYYSSIIIKHTPTNVNQMDGDILTFFYGWIHVCCPLLITTCNNYTPRTRAADHLVVTWILTW